MESSKLQDVSTGIFNAATSGIIFQPFECIHAFAPYLSSPRMFLGTAFNPERDIPDLSEKVIFVTGANGGLGKETVLQLAKHCPSKIFLAARNPSKAQDAVQNIRTVVPDADLSYIALDLASLDSVKAAAHKFLRQSTRLDMLINNAGIMAVPAGRTENGHEIQFGTNHLGHFLLTKLLLPVLQETASRLGADVRIINVSSEGHIFAPTGGICFDDLALTKEGVWSRYGQAKLANILHSKELARRYPDITTVSVHPGIILTDLYLPNEETNTLFKYARAIFGPLIMQGVTQGAQNQLWAATSKAVENGSYYTPVGYKSRGSLYASDAELAVRLWEWSEEVLKKDGF